MTLQDLYRECPTCKGQRMINVRDYDSECPDCNGKGGELTEAGKAIVLLIRKIECNPDLKQSAH